MLTRPASSLALELHTGGEAHGVVLVGRGHLLVSGGELLVVGDGLVLLVLAAEDRRHLLGVAQREVGLLVPVLGQDI